MSHFSERSLLWTILFCAFSFGINTSQAQTAKSVEKPVSSLNDFNSRFPQEKVYLHTDRTHYAPGEPIWFQAYLTAGYFHQPSPLSNNLYVALFSDDKQQLDQKLVRINLGVGYGVIDLPDSLPSGSYVLRAYTKWMQNFDEAFFYEKELTILGYNSNNTPQTVDAIKQDIAFFPEGGHMVDQVAGRIAFKVTDNTGYPMEATGQVFDDTGKAVADIKTEHDGMGLVVFTPQKDRSYVARLEGSDQEYALPPVEARGYSIAVNNNIADVLRLTFRSNDATRKKDKLGVVIHTRGAVVYAFDLDVSKNIAFTNLPKANLPEGIAHITLFDASDKAILERLVYIEKDKQALSFATDKTDYEKREKVTATIELKDAEGQPVSGAFSLSAIDLGQSIDKKPEATILSDLLLTSDLKGYIGNPMYYFDEANADRKKHLDLIMMTHGWSRFRWEGLSDQLMKEPQYGVEQSLTISGTLLKVASTKPTDGGRISLFNQDVIPPVMVETQVGPDGRFAFENQEIYDNQELLLQGQNRKGKPLVDVTLDSILKIQAPVAFDLKPVQAQLYETMVELFEEKSRLRDRIDEAYDFDSTATDLGTIIVEGNRQAVKEEDEARKGLFGKGDNTVRFEEEEVIAANNPIELLSGRIAGVVVTGAGNNTNVVIRGAVTGAGSSLAPLILIDDVPTDLEGIRSFPGNLIERVEVFRGPSAAVFGTR